MKLSIPDVKHVDAAWGEVNELQIIELLQNEMTGVEQQLTARVLADPLEKHFQARAIVQILAGMDFETQIDARLIECVEDGTPARRQFIEGGLDQSGGPLRPRVDVG